MDRHPDVPRSELAAERSERVVAAAFAFVILALLGLAVAPAVLLQRLSHATEAITATILPAYEAVSQLVLAAQERVVAARSSALTGDPIYARRLADAKAAERAALGAVRELVPRLGSPPTAEVERLRVQMERRDSLELAVADDFQAYLAAVPRFTALNDSITAALGSVRRELAAVAAARVRDGARAAALQRSLAVLLAALALGSALVIGWFALAQRRLGRGLRRALVESDRLRAVAEHRREELERVTESRVRLLRGITHDVKNPLGAAKGYAELLAMGIKGPLQPEQERLATGIGRAVDEALGIIGDLLDLARAESGALELHPVEVELGGLVSEAVERHRAAAEAVRHRLELETPAQPVALRTDPARVQEVLGNLLSNAVKYTPPPGRIEVRVEAVERGGAARAAVRVLDSGPGVPPHLRDAVFDEFSRLDHHSGLKGHGLGLAMARRIARLLGGDVTLEDAPGGGAAFTLWLPLGEAAPPTRPSGAAATAYRAP